MVSRVAGGAVGGTSGGTGGAEVTVAEASEPNIADTILIGSLILPRLQRA